MCKNVQAVWCKEQAKHLDSVNTSWLAGHVRAIQRVLSCDMRLPHSGYRQLRHCGRHMISKTRIKDLTYDFDKNLLCHVQNLRDFKIIILILTATVYVSKVLNGDDTLVQKLEWKVM
jgi:hypothetical protein